MADRAIERRRIADQRLEDESGERERQRMRKGHDGGADLRVRAYDALAYHGGALDVARRLVPDAPKPWIDLSTGINPHAYPLPRSRPEAWTRLPEPRRSPSWSEPPPSATARRPEVVVAGPGLAGAHPGAGAASLRGSRRRARTHLRRPCRGLRGRRRAAVDDADSLAGWPTSTSRSSSTPTTPTAAIASAIDLLDLHGALAGAAAAADRRRGLRRFRRRRCRASRPVCPQRGASSCARSARPMGWPGLRLGFAIASPDIAKPLRAALGPWPVSGPAIAIGDRALPDLAWARGDDARVSAADSDAARRASRGHTAGAFSAGRAFSASPPTRTRQARVFERLLAAGILTRPFADAPGLGCDSGFPARRRMGGGAALARRPFQDDREPLAGDGLPSRALPHQTAWRTMPGPRRAPRVFTIPSGAPFLPTLSRALLDGR